MSLGRAGRQARGLSKKIKRARATASDLSRRINSPGDLKLFSDLWDDRQYQMLETPPVSTPAGEVHAFAIGMEVEHTVFGPGVVLAVTPDDSDTFLTVDFVSAGQKTLAASLVVDKLIPR